MTPIERARLSLEGLSLGDAFGERFFVAPSLLGPMLEERALPRGPWCWTDDTAMAIGIVEVLAARGTIDRGELARAFARRFHDDPVDRGYGGGARKLLTRVHGGEDWQAVSAQLFAGKGSKGNGGGMRVAPLGAFFADAPEAKLVEEALASAEVTHAHPDGQAGAVAVAAAAAFAWRRKHGGVSGDLLSFAIELTPESKVREMLRVAKSIPPKATVKMAAKNLGSGDQVLAEDTVPFALWCAARHLDDYEQAMWTTVSGLGDRDTTCAMVGGIVALSVGIEGLPPHWRAGREPLP